MEADVPADLNSVLGERLQDNDKQEEIELYYELLSSGHSVGEILDSLGHIQRRSEHGHITTAEPPLSGVDGVPPEVTPGPALRGAAQANTRRTAGSIAPVEAESRRTEEPQATESAQLNELGSGDRGQFPDTTLPGSESNIVRSTAAHISTDGEIASYSGDQEPLQSGKFPNTVKRIAFLALFTVVIASVSIAGFSFVNGDRDTDPAITRIQSNTFSGTEPAAVQGLVAGRSETVVEIPKPNEQATSSDIFPVPKPSRFAAPGSAAPGPLQRDAAEVPAIFPASTIHTTQAVEPSRQAQTLAVSNRSAVRLIAGHSGDVSVRMAEEIAGIVDDGTTSRAISIVGEGNLQSIASLKYRRGIDLAIVPVDALEYAREQRPYPGLENSLTYIVKLYNQELHLLARSDIKKVANLHGQVVNVDVKGSSTALTTSRLLKLLHIKAKIANDNQEVALQKLRNGEIAALAFVAPKPAPFFKTIDTPQGLHLLNIPLTPAVAGAYERNQITADDYPRLVTSGEPTDTIAVGTVLVAADLPILSDRYRNLLDFIDALFKNFQGLLAPGHDPKWQEVNVAAELPRWERHPRARQWLRQDAYIADNSSPSRVVNERR